MNTWRFAFLAGLAVTLGGLALDLALGGRGFPAPAWPDSGILLLLFFCFQGLVWYGLRNTALFAGLSGGRLAVVSLAVVGLWSLSLGSFPQVVRGEEAPVFQRVMQAPPFVVALGLLLSNLGWGILKRLESGLGRTSLFLFNHIGVYVLGVAALFGSGDIVRLDIWVKEGHLAWTGTDGEHSHELPFAIHLEHFRRDFYPAQITVISEDGKILLPRGHDLLTVESGKEASFFGYTVNIREATMEAPWSAPGDPIPAAYLEVIAADGTRAEGWVSCGSSLMPPVFLPLGDIAFAMPEPRSRSYESQFVLVLPDDAIEPTTYQLRVNEPVKVAGWWLYQKGYRLDGGPSARYSQIEAVRDPWLPVVYTGMGMMAIGGLLAFGRAGMLLRQWQRILNGGFL